MIYLFEGYSLDSDLRELRRGSDLVALEPQVFDLLHYLIRNRDHVVSKDDMIAAIWNGRIVSESALTSRLTAVRHAVGDSGEEQRLIRTMPRKGLRFVGDVREEPRSSKVTGPGLGPALPLPDKPSVAVLPFTNMSSDPEQEYFSDGITEDIITDLSKVSALNVLSRNTTFTFRGKAVDVGQIARRLKVGYVVEGSVRKAGGRVRITAQLIDARKDSHVWGERYDRELSDIFALQDEIAQAIVAALKIRLLPVEKQAIERRSTHEPTAYQNYLLGRYYLMQHGARNLEIAMRFCQRALEFDPHYSRAWAVVALCQAFLRLRGRSEVSGLSAAEKALALDPNLAEAHAARGAVLAELGRYDEALAAHEESLRLEPDSFDVRNSYGQTRLYLGHHQAALEHFERAAQLRESDYAALCEVANCYRLLGRHDESMVTERRTLERIEKEIALRPDNARAMVFGAVSLAYLGEKERAKEWASRALTIEPNDEGSYYNLACAFAQMAEPDYALDLLESYLRRAPPEYLPWVQRDTDLLPLHGYPRFQALIARAESRLAAVQTGLASTAG